MINVEFRSNDGAGYIKKMDVEAGTTAIAFFSKMMDRHDENGELLGRADPAKYVIRINGEQMKGSYVLQQGDVFSVSPNKVEGA
jgi:hypothetical protein